MRNHHFHLQYFNFYDLDGMGRHLEKMAARGWMLEKMTTFGWHYRRMEPKRLRFTVTYHDTFSVFDPEQSEGQQEYQDLCRQSGWEVAAANGPLQAFYTEDEDAPPIETDPQLFLETVERLAKKALLSDVLLLVLSVLEAWMLAGTVLTAPIRFLAAPHSLVIGICWLSILVDTSLTLFSYWRWHQKAKAAAAVGEFTPVRSHRRFRVTLALAAVGVLYIVIASRLPGYGLLFLGIFLALCPIFIVPAVTQRILKQRRVPAKVNKRFTLLSNVVTSLLVTVLLTALLFSLVGNPAFHLEAEDLEAPLTMADLTGADDARYVHRVHLDRSVFVQDFTCTVEAPFDRDADLPEISYEIVDVWFPPFYHLCRNALIDPGYGDGYIPRDPLRGVPAVYKDAEGYPSYILCWDKRLVRLSATFPLTEPQLETAAEILAP